MKPGITEKLNAVQLFTDSLRPMPTSDAYIVCRLSIKSGLFRGWHMPPGR